eukprot:11376563-Alexandrium_andersonii.AAC.1
MSKTNRGDAIGSMQWATWTDTWRMTVEEKKSIFTGARKILAGGPPPEGCDERTRGPNNWDPVFFHSMPE